MSQNNYLKYIYISQMNQEPWLQKRNELKAVSNEAAVAPNRYILVSCRPLEDAENKVLSQNFKHIIVDNSALNSNPK